MTDEATRLAARFRADLEALDQLAQASPVDADALVCALVSHLTAWRPRPLTTPAPEFEARDPRGGAG